LQILTGCFSVATSNFYGFERNRTLFVQVRVQLYQRATSALMSISTRPIGLQRRSEQSFCMQFVLEMMWNTHQRVSLKSKDLMSGSRAEVATSKKRRVQLV